MPATSTARNRLLFFLVLLQTSTVLMKQTRQTVRSVKQSIFHDCLWVDGLTTDVYKSTEVYCLTKEYCYQYSLVLFHIDSLFVLTVYDLTLLH